MMSSIKFEQPRFANGHANANYVDNYDACFRKGKPAEPEPEPTPAKPSKKPKAPRESGEVRSVASKIRHLKGPTR